MSIRSGTRAFALAIAFTSLGSAAANAAPADSQPVRLQPRIMLSPTQAARLQAAADEGMTSLRRYLWRTRYIYNYSLNDLI